MKPYVGVRVSEERIATRPYRTLEEVLAAWGDTDTPEFKEGLRQARIEQDYGAFVYDLRVAVGMSRIALGKHIGMTGGDVQGMEEGGVSPTLEMIERIATALGVRLRLVADGEAGQRLAVMEVTGADE